jgi:nitric oxide reductase subunit C
LLSRSKARAFFLIGTGLTLVCFVLLTADTFGRVPAQTNQAALTPEAIRGKHLFDRSNCMGCHTILGEGAYYAPELTKVYDRRGPAFIEAMLRDPEKMYPGQRRMWNYDFSDREIADLVAFLEWIGKMDLNGFPAKPSLGAPAAPSATSAGPRPVVFDQLCTACHRLGGQGGMVGPALDDVGSRLSHEQVVTWLRDPLAVKPGTAMPKLPLTEEQRQELATFLTTKAGGQP